jgi:hypothetical protein
MDSDKPLELPPHWQRALPFALVAAVCIVAAGFLAAIVAPDASEHAVWAIAYLVLVGGVAQLGLGVGQWLLAEPAPSTAMVTAELISLNLGSALVIAGTFADSLLMTDSGAVVFALSLVLFLVAVRGARDKRRLVLNGYRLLLLILIVSAPIGLILARHG